jgi:hypothetical protein
MPRRWARALAPSGLKILKLAGYFSRISKPETINITLDFRKKASAGDRIKEELKETRTRRQKPRLHSHITL